MNADLFIKAVLFLHRYLSSCSAEQLRYTRHYVYHKMLDVSSSDEHMLYEHMYEFLAPYRACGNGWFLPRLGVEYIVNLMMGVDKFYRNADWDAIDQACQKLSEIYVNDKAAYDKYAEFFKAYTDGYYGDYTRRRCLLRNSQPEED